MRVKYRGKILHVDKEDLRLLLEKTWYWKDGYLARGVGNKQEGIKTIFFHRKIMGNPPCFIDHINRNPADNRKRNLRHADFIMNGLNRNKRTKNKTGHLGVYKYGSSGAGYIVKIAGKYYGSFKTKQLAITTASLIRHKLLREAEINRKEKP